MFSLFRMLKGMYNPYGKNPIILDFYARLYLSTDEIGKDLLKFDLFTDEDWQLVEKRIKELEL